MTTAPDPTITLPGSDDLVRSFLADLSTTVENLLKMLIQQSGSGSSKTSGAVVAGPGPTTILWLQTSTSCTWKAPRDYHIRNVVTCDSSAQWVLDYTGVNRTVRLAAGTQTKLGDVIAWASSAVDQHARGLGMDVFIPKDTLIQMTTTAAAAVSILVYLTEN